MATRSELAAERWKHQQRRSDRWRGCVRGNWKTVSFQASAASRSRNRLVAVALPNWDLSRAPTQRCRDWGYQTQRVKGIEPSCVAWEATVLPLNYTRVRKS